MKIIKKINNNFALAQDDQGRALVAYGKGIGFPSMPYQLDDLSKIDRTFYDVQAEHIPMFMNADEKVISVAMNILDYARLHVQADIADYLYYVLVDHISFTIDRYKNKIYVPMKLSTEIRYNYAKEYEAGLAARRMINRKFDISLPKDEAAIIAMHIVEAEQSNQKSGREISNDDIINQVMEIVAGELNIVVNPDDFNVYRFHTHLKYLIQRVDDQEINSQNVELYEVISEKYPEVNKCTEKVVSYLSGILGREINREEKLYLMLHINRFKDRI